jgi:hypothetical protein
MIYTHEIVNRNLSPMALGQLFMALNLAEQGATVTVYLTAPKVTETKPRIGGGVDFVSIPGLAPDAQIGTLTVHRYVDNPANRREDRVNAVYFKVKSITRANGFRDHGFTNLRPSQITSFTVLGLDTYKAERQAEAEIEEMATKALAEAASQTPSGV